MISVDTTHTVALHGPSVTAGLFGDQELKLVLGIFTEICKKDSCIWCYKPYCIVLPAEVIESCSMVGWHVLFCLGVADLEAVLVGQALRHARQQ